MSPNHLFRLSLYGLLLLTAGLLAGYAVTEWRCGFSVSLLAYLLVAPFGLAAGLGGAWYWWQRRHWVGWLTAVGVAGTLLLLSMLLGIALSQPAAYQRYRHRAALAEQALRTYYQQHRRFPLTLDHIPTGASYSPWLSYQATPDGQAFTLNYSADEWHQTTYQSSTHRWTED